MQRTARERDGLTRPTAEEPCDAAHFDEMRFHRPCWGGIRNHDAPTSCRGGTPGVGAGRRAATLTGCAGRLRTTGTGRGWSSRLRSSLACRGWGGDGTAAGLMAPQLPTSTGTRARIGEGNNRAPVTLERQRLAQMNRTRRGAQGAGYLVRAAAITSTANANQNRNVSNLTEHPRRTSTTEGRAPPCMSGDGRPPRVRASCRTPTAEKPGNSGAGDVLTL